jgi:hypothetical protein
LEAGWDVDVGPIEWPGGKLKSVSEDLLLSVERDDVRMTLPFLY